MPLIKLLNETSNLIVLMDSYPPPPSASKAPSPSPSPSAHPAPRILSSRHTIRPLIAGSPHRWFPFAISSPVVILCPSFLLTRPLPNGRHGTRCPPGSTVTIFFPTSPHHTPPVTNSSSVSPLSHSSYCPVANSTSIPPSYQSPTVKFSIRTYCDGNGMHSLLLLK